MSMLVERETSAGSEGARRATVDPAGRDAAGVEDPEVVEQAKRRRFTAVALLFGLIASGQIQLRRIDGYQRLSEVLEHAEVAA